MTADHELLHTFDVSRNSNVRIDRGHPLSFGLLRQIWWRSNQYFKSHKPKNNVASFLPTLYTSTHCRQYGRHTYDCQRGIISDRPCRRRKLADPGWPWRLRWWSVQRAPAASVPRCSWCPAPCTSCQRTSRLWTTRTAARTTFACTPANHAFRIRHCRFWNS